MGFHYLVSKDRSSQRTLFLLKRERHSLRITKKRVKGVTFQNDGRQERLEVYKDVHLLLREGSRGERVQERREGGKGSAE